MPDDVKLPKIGSTKKTWLWAGGALVVGIVGVSWWRRRTASTAAAAAAASPDAVPADRVPPSTVVGDTAVNDQGLTVTTAAQWGTHAEDVLTNMGYDPLAVGKAIGKYLTRQHLTTAEIDIIRTAIGQLGPVPGADYPILGPEAPPSPDKPHPHSTMPGLNTVLRGGLHVGPSNILGAPIAPKGHSGISLYDLASYILYGNTTTRNNRVTAYYRKIVSANPAFHNDPGGRTRLLFGNRIALPAVA